MHDEVRTDTVHTHCVLPRGKNSDPNFYFIAYFQPLVPKNTLYHNEIILYNNFAPVKQDNVK